MERIWLRTVAGARWSWTAICLCVRPRTTSRATVASRGDSPSAAHRGRARNHSRPCCVNSVMTRSEEHTSELQSQSNLVCRLLLEKKKKNKNTKIQLHAHSIIS